MTYFGEELLEYLETKDVVDDHTAATVHELLHGYFSNVMNVSYYHVQTNHLINDRIGLKTVRIKNAYWSSDAESRDATIRNERGSKFINQSGYAYETRTKLWVTSCRKDTPLACADTYRNSWAPDEDPSNQGSLPKYQTPKGRQDSALTAIVVPLERDHSVFGVLDLELDREEFFTKEAADEIERIAKAIAVLLTAYWANVDSVQGTQKSIKRLETLFGNHRDDVVFGVPPKPQLFVAASAAAEEDVLKVIERVARNDFKDRFELVHWQIIEPGSIYEHLWQRLDSSTFAICLLSEPDPVRHRPSDSEKRKPGNGYHYRDNPNVLFEAGYLQSRGIKWIPIREQDSPELPFDLRAQSILSPERTKTNASGGKLDEKRFAKDLGERLEFFLTDV